MRLILKQHNKVAYERVMAAFEKDRMTCVCHPTGTGKSYIVAAVTEHFKRVLILAPNIFVLRQQQTVINWRNDIEYRSYQWLNNNVTDITERYDLIVIDEFHRAGAPEWSAAVELLIESQPQAKVLGTTATPIRYLDDERNMADELFNGHVASEMTIAEAWNRHILPIPTYVTGIFSFTKVVEDATERIMQNGRIPEEEKRKRIFRLSNKKLAWEKSIGMTQIISKHLPKDIRRIIVFCSHIEDLEPMRQEVQRWMKQAGFNICGCYNLHSDQTEREQRETMERFESDDGEGVKVIFSVNMLNEGIHIPQVGAVIMLRTTSSRIIYMQQMGRALTAANTERPIVLDMVDNITTTTNIQGIADEFNHEAGGEEKAWDLRHFNVIDYTLGVRQLVSKLTRATVKYENRLPEIVKFFEENQRPPSRAKLSSEKEKRISIIWDYIKFQHPEDPTVQKWRAFELEYMANLDMRHLAECVEFAEKNGRTPTHARKEDRLGNIWKHLKTHYPDHPDVIRIQEKYGKEAVMYQKMMRVVNAVAEHCEKTGHQIRACEDSKLFGRWYMVKKTYGDRPEVKAIVEKYPEYNYTDVATQNGVKDVQAFRQKYGRFPRQSDPLISRWTYLRKFKADVPEVQALITEWEKEPIRREVVPVETRAEMWQDYYKINGGFPDRTKQELLYRRLINFAKAHTDHPSVQSLMSLSGFPKLATV